MVDLDKQISRFLKRKSVKNILGDDYNLSPNQYYRLEKLFEVYKTPKNIEHMLETVAKFVYYDVTNYVGRYKRLAGKPGTSKYSQMLRYGRQWQSIYESQSRSKMKSLPNKIETWIDRGYSYNEACDIVKSIQYERGMLAAKKLKGTSCHTIRSKEYWIRQGYSEEEAKEKVRKIQTNNGIEFYKEKYPEDYERKFQERINQWFNTFYKNNDVDLVNLKKSPTIKGGLARGLSYQEAENRYLKHLDHLRNIRKSPSKISQKMCHMIFDELKEKCYYSDLNYEFLIKGYRVDFYHEESKTVVEFYGDFFHRNPKMFSEDHLALETKAKDRWYYDKLRENRIKSSNKVKNFYIVWESEFRENPRKVVQQIIEGIKNGNC